MADEDSSFDIRAQSPHPLHFQDLSAARKHYGVPSHAQSNDDWILGQMEEVGASVSCRLLSHRLFQGQVNDATSARGSISGETMCPRLVIHFHGGGFVAMDSKSHEVCVRVCARVYTIHACTRVRVFVCRCWSDGECAGVGRDIIR